MDGQGVFIQCNKWRPYYYDMFNRVGNLTVLSLSRRRNAIIENLHTYKNKSNTWHDRLRRKFPEEEFSDFTSIRIYWKYPEGQNAEPGVNRGPPDEKGYFMFSNDAVEELRKFEYGRVWPVLSRRIREQQLERQKHLKTKDFSEDTVLASPQELEKEKVNQFWRKQIGNLAMRYPLFSQDHTYLTVQVIQGLEKFPIQYWNNPGEKLGLALKDLSVASFFFKSAYKVLES